MWKMKSSTEGKVNVGLSLRFIQTSTDYSMDILTWHFGENISFISLTKLYSIVLHVHAYNLPLTFTSNSDIKIQIMIHFVIIFSWCFTGPSIILVVVKLYLYIYIYI